MAIMLAMAVSACGPADDPDPVDDDDDPDPAEDIIDTVVIAFTTDFYDLDPHGHHLRSGIIRDVNQFDSLLHRDAETGDVIPSLAVSWEPIDDLTWEFKLREGVKFQNGDPFTAHDVKFSIERIQDPAEESPQYGNVEPIKEVEVIDDYTVRLHTEFPWPLILQRMAFCPIIPKDYYQEVGREEFVENAPIGTGLYQHVDWARDDFTLQTRFEDHWRGPAPIENVRWVIIPETSTQVAELKTGGIHIMRDLPPDLIPELEAHDDTYVSTNVILRTDRMFFDTREWPMSDRSFRQACNYAIDWDAIIDRIMGGLASRLAVSVTPMHFGFHPDLEPYPYDPDKAKELLEEAGYFDNPVPFTFHHPMAGAYRDVGDAVAGYLEEVGINIEVIYHDEGPTFFSLRNAGELDPKGMFYGAWGSYSMFDAAAILEPDFDTDIGLFGRWYWEHEEVDQMLLEARRTTDMDLREQLYREIQEIVHEEAPQIFMFHRNEILGVNKAVEIEARVDELIFLEDVKPVPR